MNCLEHSICISLLQSLSRCQIKAEIKDFLLRYRLFQYKHWFFPNVPEYTFTPWIMQHFSAEGIIFFRKYFFLPMKTWKNSPQSSLLSSPNCFLVLPTSPKQPKICPNLKFCSIKIAHCATYIMLLGGTQWSNDYVTKVIPKLDAFL